MSAFFAVPVLLVSILLTLSLWPARTAIKRMAAVVVFAGFILVTLLAHADLLGRPRPVSLEWSAGTVVVLAYRLDHGRAIYLWVMPDGRIEPLYYVLPWRDGDAGDLQRVMSMRNLDGGQVRFRFNRSLENRSNDRFYRDPPQDDPLKRPPDPAYELD